MLASLMVFAVLVLTVYGQLMIKARALAHATPVESGSGKLSYLITMVSDIGVLSGFAAGLLATVCWMLALERVDLSYAYPFMALSFVLVPVGSMVFLGEGVPTFQFVGLGLIVMGVTVSALAR